jgi:uncharacterized protein YecT (DUF1311 family)
MRHCSIALAPLALAAGFVQTAPARADAGYDACVDNASTNADFSACGGAMLERREGELNRAWKQAYADLDVATKRALLDEQRAWIVFKDKSCGYWAGGAFGREGQVIHFYTCREQVITQRIAYLEAVGEP